MQGPRVHVICQNYRDDRIIPRMARLLRDRLGWSLSGEADPAADVLYLSGYFEAQRLTRWPDRPVAAYFTHREEMPKNNAKARLYDRVADQVQLRVATCALYAKGLRQYGPTVQAAAPLERAHFCLGKHAAHDRPVVGLSGYTYANHRKGEDLAAAMLNSAVGQAVEWRASGRGWPVETRRHTWAQMPGFYQGLDVLVVPSRVEGIPMPPLEALACGTAVVVPRGVGLLDELPELPGIWRYNRGEAASLIDALEQALAERDAVDHEALRAATGPYSEEAWCDDHRQAMEMLAGEELSGLDGGDEPADAPITIRDMAAEPVERETGSSRGIYCVAFGDPARRCAERMMRSAKAHLPEIPICLAAATPIGVEDVFVEVADSDAGGRRAKLRAYELAPAEWRAVLYLDADTEVVSGDIRFYFELIEDGWELAICTDPHLDSREFLKNRATLKELDATTRQAVTLQTTQFNGGVWAFGRTPAVARFFHNWATEWEKFAQRDQGALTRAIFAEPLRVYLLGNEWNTFPEYQRGFKTAGLYHYPGTARRWAGNLPGRTDSAEAWRAVAQFEQRGAGRRGKTLMSSDRGILLLGEDATIAAGAARAGLPVRVGAAGAAYSRTLLVRPGTPVPWALVATGFQILEHWDAAVPLSRVGITAETIGSEQERQQTAAVIRELRVPTYATELIFVRDSADGRALLEAWARECAGGGNEQLAFLRAFYQVKPRLCALPATWLAQVQKRSRPGRLVRVEIAPGRYAMCREGHEAELLARYRNGCEGRR